MFAVVSPDYGVMDINELGAYLEPVFENENMRGTVFYDSSSTDLRIEALWGEHLMIGKELWRHGVQIRANDRGQGGIQMLALAVRDLGLNQFILESSKDALYYTQHQGDMSRVGPSMKKALGQVRPRFDVFADQWRLLANTSSGLFFLGATKAFLSESVFATIAVNLGSGLRKDMLIKLLVAELEKLPGGWMSHFLLAVTALHRNEQVNMYRREKIEASARGIACGWAIRCADKGWGNQPLDDGIDDGMEGVGGDESHMFEDIETEPVEE